MSLLWDWHRAGELLNLQSSLVQSGFLHLGSDRQKPKTVRNWNSGNNYRWEQRNLPRTAATVGAIKELSRGRGKSRDSWPKPSQGEGSSSSEEEEDRANQSDRAKRSSKHREETECTETNAAVTTDLYGELVIRWGGLRVQERGGRREKLEVGDRGRLHITWGRWWCWVRPQRVSVFVLFACAKAKQRLSLRTEGEGEHNIRIKNKVEVSGFGASHGLDCGCWCGWLA